MAEGEWQGRQAVQVEYSAYGTSAGVAARPPDVE